MLGSLTVATEKILGQHQRISVGEDTEVTMPWSGISPIAATCRFNVISLEPHVTRTERTFPHDKVQYKRAVVNQCRCRCICSFLHALTLTLIIGAHKLVILFEPKE